MNILSNANVIAIFKVKNVKKNELRKFALNFL